MILIIDTTTNNLSLGLAEGKNIIDSIIQDGDRKQSEIMMDKLKALLKNNKKTLKDISEIYITTGPGSFTGVRIGLTFARTVNQLLNTPVRTINTLHAIAGNRSGTVSIDARSEQSFIAEYENGNEIKKPQLAPATKGTLETDNILASMMEVYDKATVYTDVNKINALYIKDANANKLKH